MADKNLETGGRVGSALNIIAGIYLLLSPFMLGYADMVRVARNEIVTGFIVLILGIIGAASAGATRWARWLTAIFGIWLFFSPFILGYADVARAVWNDVILGILIITFSAMRTHAVPRQQPA